MIGLYNAHHITIDTYWVFHFRSFSVSSEIPITTDWSRNFVRSNSRQSTESKRIDALTVSIIKFYRILLICASQHRQSAEAISNGRLGLMAMIDWWSIIFIYLMSLHRDYKNKIKLHLISVYTFPIRCTSRSD